MNALLGLSLGEWVMESDWSNYLGKLHEMTFGQIISPSSRGIHNQKPTFVTSRSGAVSSPLAPCKSCSLWAS